MAGPTNKTFNLPWHQHEQYWIALFAKSGTFSGALLDDLQKAGAQKQADGSLAVQAPRDWKSAWDKLHAALVKHDALNQVDASVSPGSNVSPDAQKQPGDLIFTYHGGSIGHVGIYAGGSQMWAAVESGDVVRLQSFADRSYSVGRVG